MGAPIGPVIIFRIDTQQVASGTSEAMRQVREQAKATSQAVADDWKVKAAQIRASIASGTAVDKEILAARQQEVSLLEKTIASLRTRSELSVKELSTLKAATLELERQSSILRGGSGLTAGTMSFANVISGFLSRTAAQIGAGAFGVSGGSQLVTGALGGVLGEGATAGAITALAGAATAAAVAMGALAKSGADVVKNLELVSEKTGISVKDLQVLEAAGERVNVGLDDIVVGFRKFSKALVGGMEGGEDGATEASKQMKTILHDLGVTSKEPIEAIKQVADAFQKLPDGIVKADTASVLFGKTGLTLIPIFNEGRAGIEAYITVVDQYGAKIGIDLTKKTNAWEMANVTLSESFKKLKTDAADEFLPAMTGIVNFIASQAIPAFRDFAKGLSGGSSFSRGMNFFGFLGDQSADWQGGASHLDPGKDQGLAAKIAKDLATNSDAAAAALARLAEAERKYQFELPKTIQLTQTRIEQLKELRQNLFGLTGGKFGPFNAPQQGAPEIPLGSANVTDVLGGIFGPSGAAKSFDLVTQINKEHDDLFTTQRDKVIQHYQEELKDLNDAHDQKLISTEHYNEELTKLNQDENKTLDDLADSQSKKMQEQAGKLFDDLLSGHGKNFGKKISEDLLKIFTEPEKKAFEDQFKNIFGPLVGGSSTSGGTSTSTGAPQTGGWLAKIFGLSAGGFGGSNAPGGTPGYFPGSIGLGGATSTGSTGTGQFGVATMNVTAGVVNISGTLGLPGTGPLGNSTGNFFGNLNPFSAAGTGSTGVGDLPFPGDSTGGASAIGSTLSSLGPYIGAAAMVGAGIASKSPTAIAMGMSGLAKGGIAQIIKNSPSLGGTGTFGSGALGLGTVSQALPGIGLFGAGVAQGGVGGTLEATAGGAEAGLAFGGPVGAAIGAGVGLISGIVSSLIQGPSFASKVAHNMAYDAYRLPPSETFSFAEGSSMAQTMSTGAVRSGSTFSAFGLPSNTPFWADPVIGRLDKNQQRNYLLEQMGLNNNQPFEGLPNVNPFVGQDPIAVNKNAQPAASVSFTIHAIDAKGVADFLQQHGATITQHIANQVTNSSSGFASRVRMAAFPP